MSGKAAIKIHNEFHHSSMLSFLKGSPFTCCGEIKKHPTEYISQKKWHRNNPLITNLLSPPGIPLMERGWEPLRDIKEPSGSFPISFFGGVMMMADNG